MQRTFPPPFVVLALLGVACKGEPPPEGCGEGLVADGQECVPAACDPAAWADLSADHRVAVEGGTHTSLADALADAQDGDVIAVDMGNWDAPGEITRNVSIIGRCQETVLSAAAESPTLAVQGAQVQIAHLTLEGGLGARVTAGHLGVEDVLSTGASEAGFLVSGDGATASLQRVVITEASAGAQRVAGIEVEAGGTVEVAEVEISRTRGYGVFVSGAGSEVFGSGLRVAALYPADELPDRGTVGIYAEDDGEASLTDVDIEGQTLAGVLVDGGVVELQDTFLHDNTPDASQQNGRGLTVKAGSAIARNLRTDRIWEASVFVAGATARVEIVGGEFIDGQATSMLGETDGQGAGVFVRDGASARVEGVTVKGSRGYAFAARSGTLELVDCIVRDSLKSKDTSNMGEAGLWVDYGATVTATNLSIGDVVESGILVGGLEEDYDGTETATLTMVGGEVFGTTDENGYNGYGLLIRPGARVTLDGVSVHDNFGPGLRGRPGDVQVSVVGGSITGNRNAGIQAEGGVWTLEGTSVSGQIYDEQWGGAAGIVAWDLEMTLTDVEIVSNEGFGIAGGGASTVVITGGEVRDTRLYAAPTAKYQLGWGVFASDGAVLTLDGVSVADNIGFGVIAMEGSSIELQDCDISGTKYSPDYSVALGLTSNYGDVRATSTRVHDTEGPGVGVFGGSVWISESELDHNGYAGAVTSWGALEVEETFLHDNTLDASEGGGVGLYVSDDWEAEATLRDSTVTGHTYAAVWAAGGAVQVDGCDLEGGSGVPVRDDLLMHGNGVFGISTQQWNGKQGLLVRNTSIHDAAGAGVLLHGGSATFSNLTFSENATNAVQQSCSDDTPPPEGLDEAILCPETNELIDELFLALYLEDISVESW